MRSRIRRLALPFFLACVFLLTGRPPASAQVRAARTADERPNILVILADDLGYRDVSFRGATEIETPHLDRIAEAGVVFSNGYVAYPLCVPSRAALMTGRYPARFGAELLGEVPTIARYLQEAGYRTGIVGKWHLGTAPIHHPLNLGFDYFYGFTGGGHDYYRIDVTESPLREYLLPLNDGRGASGFSGYLTDALTDRAVEFVAADRGDEPFFLYLAYNAPHTPLQAPAETVHKYRHVEDEQRRTYLAMIDALDANVGRVVAALQAADRWENTLTFFLSDNGGGGAWADNGPLRAGKGSLFEGGIRVPFAASWPARWAGGTTFEPMVISLDVAATALAVAGADAEPHVPLDGVNLDPYLRGAAPGVPHQALFWQAGGDGSPNRRFAVRAAGAKLHGTPEKVELFDLRADPGEERDVSAAQADTAARLLALHDDWRERTSDDYFWTSWSERESMRNLIHALYRATVAREPAARSTWDVYLDPGRVTFVKEPCTAQDTRGRFAVHLFPAYTFYSNRYQFENIGFDFREYGVILDGRCLAVVPFPDYELTYVRTGQWIPGGDVGWSVEFPVPSALPERGGPAAR